MTIAEYIKKQKIDVKEFARLCGVSAGIARLWACGAVSPRLIHAHYIQDLTKGKIKMHEMLSNSDKQALEIARI